MLTIYKLKHQKVCKVCCAMDWKSSVQTGKGLIEEHSKGAYGQVYITFIRQAVMLENSINKH